MLFEQAGKYILKRLGNELPAHLTYHHTHHITDVHQAAKRIGKQEGISDAEMQLLLTAALYHDAGFLVGPDGHEEVSCRIAKEILPQFEYRDNEIEIICGLIRATRIPQSPRNHLEQVLADADLDYLGREDFETISDKLYHELAYAGKVNNKQQWDLIQVKFMENHHYFTQTSINTRQAQKERNLAKIKLQTLSHN